MKVYYIKCSKDCFKCLKDRIKQLIGKNLNIELICKNKYIANKIKFYNDENKSDLRDE